MQTLLVHTRRPLHLIRTTGPLGFLGFVFFIGGTVLVRPAQSDLLGALSRLAGRCRSTGFDPVFPQILLFLSLFNLLAGNGAFMYLCMLAPIRRGWLDLIPFSLTVFGYWVLMSIAAYKALWQLLRNPFYWEKTQHGVLASSARAAPSVKPRPRRDARARRHADRRLRLHGGADAGDASPCSTASCPTMP